MRSSPLNNFLGSQSLAWSLAQAILSLEKIRMNQICMSKVISDQRLLENAWAKELVHKICMRQIFQYFFETPHEWKLHQWNLQKPRTGVLYND